ncbi:MAG: class I SAM-dependent methyltransferase [Actinomycetota bacterium]
MDYCLPKGYQARLEPDDPVREDDEGFWLPAVYPESASLATRLGARCIVGVGCGTGKRLAALHPSFEIIGIDTPSNIAVCRERYDFGTWVEIDLENDDSLDVPDLTGAVLVCENLLERLVNPEELLALVSDALEKGAAAFVLATPDRALNKDGHLGPPANPAHAREWTGAELAHFMASMGLRGHLGLTRSNDLAPFMRTILAVVPGLSADQREVVDSWWYERTRWQRMVEEQDRTILQQHAWTGELRRISDWSAQQRDAWEVTAREREAQLLERDRQIAELQAALARAVGQAGTLEQTSLRWALRLALRLARAAGRVRPRRS